MLAIVMASPLRQRQLLQSRLFLLLLWHRRLASPSLLRQALLPRPTRIARIDP
jgi:hypothetical protein